MSDCVIRTDNPVKPAIAHHLASVSSDVVAASLDIHAHPELAFEETHASGVLTDMLANAGFAVDAGIHGLATAFNATIGTGPCSIVLCAEYDALPGMGHACGHNLIAGAAVGAALALQPFVDDLGLTVRVLGTPAEERGGGKALLLEAGAFAGAQAAMMIHPAALNAADFTCNAIAQWDVRFIGRESHAAIAPHRGVNAADAVHIAQTALALLRQHLEPGDQIHGIVTNGGSAPNVIPGEASASWFLRSPTTPGLAALEKRVHSCFEGGAVATGCELSVEPWGPSYLDFVGDDRLVALCRSNGEMLDLAFPTERIHSGASTDMGNVSHAVRSIHPLLDIGSGDVSPHEPAFADAAGSTHAQEVMLRGATLLAWMAVDEASRPASVGAGAVTA